MKKLATLIIGGYLIATIAIPKISAVLNLNTEYVQLGEYTFEKGTTKNLSGIVFTAKQKTAHGRSDFLYEAGIRAELGVLSESDYEEFESMESNGQCAASFLNSNSEMFLVIPDDTTSALEVISLDRGDHLNLRATILSNPVKNIDGAEIPIQITGAKIILVSTVN